MGSSSDMAEASGSFVAACLKWVDLRPEVDPLDATVHTDERLGGLSAADEAALELALQIGEHWSLDVVAVTAGASASEKVLRDALAAGATRAVRIDHQRAYDSSVVAADLARVVAGAALVLCGDWSLDRGSGSVPPFLAGELLVAQACGLVELTFGPTALKGVRRLDGGRRERLEVPRPAVVSVEGVAARLRRASISRVLQAQRAVISVVASSSQSSGAQVADVVRTEPFRPRARVHDGPPDEDPRRRVEQLTGAFSERTPPQRLILRPPEAAQVILDQLTAWGER